VALGVFPCQGGILWTVGQTDIKAKYLAIPIAAGWKRENDGEGHYGVLVRTKE